MVNDHEKIWLAPDDEIPLREKKMIFTKKYMVTIFWNLQGFHLVDILDDGLTFTADYFINNILQKIDEAYKGFPERAKRRITLHFDNVRPHTARKVKEYMSSHRMKRAPHPPYSPDIAPSDFYLFGYIKENLKGCKFESKEQLFSAITDIVSNISKDTLIKVFNHWKKRLLKVIDNKGDFY